MRVSRPLLAAALGCAFAGAALAQPDGTTPFTPPAGSPLRADGDTRLSPAVAHELERLTLIDLRMRDNAGPADFDVARILFEQAYRLNPGDAELARRIAAAAHAAGDQTALVQATREIVRLDPQDTVAQLRLINAAIAKRQTAEERLAAYERFLGPRGERLDVSIRSRLALDAALIERELGNDDQFRRLLQLAMELDVTNKDAASVALRYYEERAPDDAEGLLELQTILLHADPIDPHVHRTIATSLARQGAYRQARRMLGNAIAIIEQVTDVPTEIQLERLALDAVWDSPRVVLDDLNVFRAVLKANAERQREQGLEAGEPEADLPDPDDTRLPVEYERIRLIVASIVGDEDAMRESADELRDTVLDGVGQINDYLAAGGLTAQQQAAAIQEYMTQFMTLQGARALTGMDLEQLEGEFRAVAQSIPAIEASRPVIEPWLALHRGDPLGALELARAVEDPVATLLVRGAAYEALDRDDEALGMYLQAARTSPFEPSGIWAALRVIELAGDTALVSDVGERMAARADRIPEWIDRMITQPSTFMELRADAVATTFAVDERALVRVRLRNMAPIPLAVGSDKVISSRLMISPSLDADVRGFLGTPQPEVLEFDRRLRLEPREAITATIPADVGYTGYLVDVNARLTLRQRWRVLQAFQIGRLGAIVSGPMALTSETEGVIRRSTPEARFTPEEFALRMDGNDPILLPRTLAGMRAYFLGPGFNQVPLQDPAMGAMIEAVIRRYDRSSPLERALMLTMLPHGRQVSVFAAFDEHARRSLTPDRLTDAQGVVASLVALTRVTDPDDEVFATLRGAADPDLRALGQMLSDRLGADGQAFARIGPHPNLLAGPTPGAPRRANPNAPAD
ncbi:MAG: hypothetical protein RIB32_01260 [Phycisphaerales bacterium]